MDNIIQTSASPAQDTPALTRESLVWAMQDCSQNATQSVLDHGQSVWRHFVQMRTHLAHGTPLEPWWRVPAWTATPGLLDRLMPMDVLEEYATYHDCGKPFCRVEDPDGRVRFPNHAAISEATWLSMNGHPQAARLMGMDMDAHLLKGDGIAEFAARPEAISLLLMALAEVHSNAAMFGGVDSDSFKMKAKHLDKRGRQVVAAMTVDAA